MLNRREQGSERGRITARLVVAAILLAFVFTLSLGAIDLWLAALADWASFGAKTALVASVFLLIAWLVHHRHVQAGMRIEQQLQQALEFSEGVIKALPDLLFEVDRDGTYLNVWAQKPEMLAASKERLLGRTIPQMLPPEAAEISMACVREAEEKGLSFGKVIKLDLEDGPGWFELSGSRKPGRAGEPPHFLVVSRDITERKRIEDRLQQALEFSEGVIKALPDLLFEVDRDGTYLNVWAQKPEMLAAPKEALIGKTVHDVLPPDAAAVAMSCIREAEEKGLSFGKIMKLDLPDGPGWFEQSGSRKAGRPGEPPRILVVSRDITDRMAHQEAQARLNRALRIVSAGNDLLVHAVDDGDLLTRMCQVIVDLGGARMAWIGMAEYDQAKTILPVASAGHDDGYLSRSTVSWAGEADGCPEGMAVRTGLPQTVERLETPDALERQYRSNISLPLSNEAGVFGCLSIYFPEREAFASEEIAVLVDLSNKLAVGLAARRDRRRREAAENQLKQALKMEALGQIAGNVAHDFNNLLGAIMGFARFIVEDTPEGDRSHHHAARIMTAGQRGKALIGQILSFARRTNLHPRLFSLADLQGDVTAVLEGCIPMTRVSIAMNGNDRFIHGDRGQLEQALINLCINANDAIGDGVGQVSVSAGPLPTDSEAVERLFHRWGFAAPNVVETWRGGQGAIHAVVGSLQPGRGYHVVRVADTGCGLDEALLGQIFSPFFTTKDSGHGTGLGLSMVHGVVLAHDGAVSVESRPGNGTVFEVILPAAEAGVPTLDATPPAEDIPYPPLQAGGLRLLLVDDDPHFSDMLLTALERQGFDVTPCSDPVDALAAFQEYGCAWDILVTDQTMPHIVGLDLIRAVREMGCDLPCILCTGFSQETINADMLEEAGVFALMHKPVELDDLMAVLARAMAGRRPVGG